MTTETIFIEKKPLQRPFLLSAVFMTYYVNCMHDYYIYLAKIRVNESSKLNILKYPESSCFPQNFRCKLGNEIVKFNDLKY